jgi:hypothetical protein
VILRAGLRRIWESPTANTWLSLFARSVSLVLVLPLILRQFAEAEAAAWFVFSSVIGVQGVLGFGFSPSFSRLLGYARGGAPISRMGDLRHGRGIAEVQGTNWETVDRLCKCMRTVFTALAIVSFIVMSTLGSLAVRRPITATIDTSSAWLAWAVLVGGSSVSFGTSYYTAILQGMNRLTEWRRAETVISLGAVLSAFGALLLGGRLLTLVAVNQGWVVVSWFTFRRLATSVVSKNRPNESLHFGWDAEVLRLVWASTWKTGLTGVLSQGLVQATGVIQAQFGSTASTATYNFTLRIATVLSQVAQAPFLTKLPELARLRAAGDASSQILLIRRGMQLTHWSIAFGVGLTAILMPMCLWLVGSHTFVFDQLLWSLFGWTIFLDRHGAMLNQVRNLTNRPLEHYGMFAYFFLNASFMVALHGMAGMYSYPIAMIATQVSFSLWFSAYSAYPLITNRPLAFERTVSFPPFLVMITASLIALLITSRFAP